ncbi:MAG TPA: hypothetical protein VFN65_00385 [Solirubrobacteraceae bacterium]|nr:hypothetical protein [Solirubrobacteraceae bacterium]
MSSTRSIRTSTQQVACDVCGRTLLRGERAEIYLAGGSRRSVCELCTSRALHGGWVREGTVPDYGEASDRGERRRSLLGRRRRSRRTEAELEQSPPPFADFEEDEAAPLPDLEPAAGPEPLAAPQDSERGPAPDWPDPPPRVPRRGRPGRSRRAVPFGPRQDASARPDAGPREPRHVHAVPTSIEHRIEAAVELFNGSEYPRTVAGIGRSLGLPDVAVHPASPAGAVVNIVVCWELCWYRYEVDLSEENPVVRTAGQGYELSDLSELERQTNVAAGGDGLLTA